MVLTVIGVITVVALLFIQYNSLTILDSYNKEEERGMNLSLHSLEDLITVQAEDLEKITQDYARRDDTARYVQDHTEGYLQKNFPARSLKNLGITFVAVIDPGGRVLFLKQYDPDTYHEIGSSLTNETISGLVDPDLDISSSLVSFHNSTLIISQAAVSNAADTKLHAGYVLFGVPLQSIINRKNLDSAITESSIQIFPSSRTQDEVCQFNLSSGVQNSLGEQNETTISGMATFSSPSSLSVLTIAISKEKSLLAKGRLFVFTYFWYSIFFLPPGNLFWITDYISPLQEV